jgi:hypothetical protein
MEQQLCYNSAETTTSTMLQFGILLRIVSRNYLLVRSVLQQKVLVSVTSRWNAVGKCFTLFMSNIHGACMQRRSCSQAYSFMRRI